MFALAALDIAAWDLFGKIARKSLNELISDTPAKPIRVYGTTGWLSLTEKELIAECEKYADIGIQAFKIRLGHINDFERVRAVRKAMGNDYHLMLDATQQFTVNESIKIAQKMAEFNISWLEEPVSNEDLKSVKENCDIPIAAGENMTSLNEFKKACEEKTVDVIQPDILRCGGITGFIGIAKITESFEIPLCNHLLPELSLNVLSAFSNSYYLEYDDFLPSNIFQEEIFILQGCMQSHSTVGNGIILDENALSHYLCI